jgi:RNA polymerase sigma-70 factor (ECF subfamily)
MDEVLGEPGPWLRAVAWRLALDRARRGRRESRVLEAIAARAPDPAEPRDPVEDEETRARVLAALAALPDRQRDVVHLRVLSGETFPAIARVLGVSEGSAKVHLRRALERLRGLLAPLAGAKEPNHDVR